MLRIHVNTSSEYNVLLERGLLSTIDRYIDHDARKLCIVSDETVASLYGGKEHALYQALENAGFQVFTYTFPAGEASKNIQTVTDLLQFLTGMQFTRKDRLIALGGGVTGDITGFTASIYMRGIGYYQIPTTLLAAVDSSIGGKTGVNLEAGKNLAGTFWQPKGVFFDPEVLQTLDQTQLLNGMAEIIKMGFICDKSLLYDAVHGGRNQHGPVIFQDADALMRLVAKAIQDKLSIVEQDERESGARALLNYGHTLGHAIEKCSGYQVPHGFAVATGMYYTARACDKVEWTNRPCADVTEQTLRFFGYPLDCPYSTWQLAEAAANDKKSDGVNIMLSVPEDLGKCVLRPLPAEQLVLFFECGLEKNDDH